MNIINVFQQFPAQEPCIALLAARGKSPVARRKKRGGLLLILGAE